jgi:hypothetical protein
VQDVGVGVEQFLRVVEETLPPHARQTT